ncbi:ankyrin repeat and MYND domain-containing protein 2-like [Penaeus japonicus]|uniref:ankyrin repeat and MYND domain-containing protein 2-like n=1 Tax=Penaeus japonicus TaxID=27405 RepID=UPI001C714694|nr:ankyrin repeat and MYND domain-containing protein 2-like [Penaeus japonicus]
MAGEEDETLQQQPEIIRLVGQNDVNGVKNLLLRGEAKTEETDGSGMTALHHAAYKGNAELCKLLIEHNADINSDSHDHRYSPLHFAALSGSTATVQHLLTAGAKTYYTNTLGRTAAQMAAFVGNHAVVALINNYVPLEAVIYYTKPTGLEKEAKLPNEVANPLYDLIMQVNLHPVRVAMHLEKSEVIRKHISSVYKVLDLMCEKESKRQEGVNEVICIKFHYLGYILKTLEKEIKKFESSKEKNAGEKDCPIFESIIKKWLRGREYDGIEEHLEYYIRDAIKSFPYVEMPLFIQLVRNMTGKLGDSWALGVLSGCINGQRAFQDDKACSTCGEEKKDAKKCSKCKMVQYCDRVCQKLHWTNHKKFCSRLLEDYERQQKLLEEEKKKEEEEKKKISQESSVVDSKKEITTSEPDNKDLANKTENLEIS